MTLETFDAVFWTLAFLVPGFIVDSVVASVVPRRAESEKLSLLRLLAFACFNYAFWAWLIYLLFRLEFFTEHPVRSAVAWGIIVLVSPVGLGLVLGWLHHREKIRKALQWLGFNPIHVIPTSWDWKFSRLSGSGPAWVLVTLMDGSTVCGLFGSESFASSDPEERDLFIQAVYRPAETGQWRLVARTDGIWIQADQIKHIEFWKHE